MYVHERFILHKLANQLTENDRFEVLHIDTNLEEIWLSKYENKTSTVVRIIHKEFDWKNHLKTDIATVFQKAKAMKRLLRGNIEIHNLYIATHSPVDDWEMLKKPMQLKDRKKIKMNVYYVTENNTTDELKRLHSSLNNTFSLNPQEFPSDIEMEQYIDYYKVQLKQALQKRRNEVTDVYSYGKPFFAYVLLAINIIMFLFLEINGESTSTDTLIKYGAKFNPAIIDGEWWRIVSSMFLHIGFLHLFMNMLAVYYLGTLVEKIYGSWRFLVIYFLAGVGGGITSFAFTVNVSAGASGALFGLFGALLYFGLMYKRIFFQTIGTGLLVIIAINLVFGFVVPQVDAGAHIGGLIAGFIGAAIVQLPKQRKTMKSFAFIIIFIVLLVGLILFGIQHNKNSSEFQLAYIEKLIKEKEYESVIDNATLGLNNKDEFEPLLLFQRSYAYIGLNKIDLAIEDLERSISLQQRASEEIPEAYYNLALLYFNNGDERAGDIIRKAYELRPNDEAYQELYREIIERNWTN
ncbi:rhomboid family intramembrane serine protease [Ornithinibacillus sp. L9]|uniref:Rhomboid family intramembrane serine protease n=1 Tax=Ornithinibacillus caprae TaxID=2678566 RepID=A0A6N8FC45_9BACI|nr:rhomboid family intramembrane serine protease [Ornithinibacillus caprae]MUK87123.1 rhomboid family intramembrane serine protease [Ornithinibacillus caprae]